MSDEKYPYVNHMNILYDPLELIDIKSLVDQCTDQWYNQTLCQATTQWSGWVSFRENIIGTSMTKKMNSFLRWKEN